MSTKSIQELTNEEFFRYVTEELLEGWVPLATYLRIFQEETRTAVQMRVKRKRWIRNVHYATPPGGDPWVNLIAIRQWVTSAKE